MQRFSFAVALLIIIQAASADTQLLRCGELLDVKRKDVLINHDILVEGDRITRVGQNIIAPAGAALIDLSNQVCMPGLMDVHVHIGIDARKGNLDELSVTQSAADLTLLGLSNLRKLLNQGITTIRITGDLDKGYSTISLRNAVAQGKFKGPRMLVAPHAIGPTGGHSDQNTFAYDSNVPHYFRNVDGVDEVRKAVRTEIKYGADWIKVHATGGVMSAHDDPTVPAYSDEELRAFVSETHRHHKKITAHAHGDAGIRAAVEAGFDSIEHATLLTERTAKLMAKRGTFFIPTRYVVEWVLAMGSTGAISKDNIRKANLVAGQHVEAIKLAQKHGVKMALGSDPIFPMEEAVKEYVAMSRIIADNWSVLQMGTINAASLLGLADSIGSIEAGMQADIIALTNSPIDDMHNIENVHFVMKGGTVIR